MGQKTKKGNITSGNQIQRKQQKQNNIQPERNLSVNMLSLTPHSEMNSTTTQGISELINELNSETKKLVKVYRANRMVLKKKHEQSSIIANKLRKSIKEVRETFKVVNGFNKESHIRELKINGGKSISRKRRI